jgi:hypothetical protein
MTEDEWQANHDCHRMVWFLQLLERQRLDAKRDESRDVQRYLESMAEHGRIGGYYSRKGILLSCATGRRFWHLLTDARSRDAIVATEQYADDAINEKALEHSYREACAVVRVRRNKRGYLYRFAAQAARDIAAVYSIGYPPAWVMLSRSWDVLDMLARDWSSEERQGLVCPILRDLFGNPFRPPAIDPGAPWHQDAVIRKLAQTLYDERAFDHFPILADALEEAGCTDRAILDHCRQPGQHVRGCWVLDLVLGREIG